MNKVLFALIIALILPLEVNAEIRLRDNFEYAVDRTTAGDANKFQSVGKWGAVKAINASDSNGNQQGGAGYLYTVTSIPGFSGSFPGASSSRVACVEVLARTYNTQTDFYLQLGDGTENFIPGKVWFQYWMYVNHYGTQRSVLHTRNKWMYPCNTNYPCTSSGRWMIQIGATSYNPYNTAPYGDPSNGHVFFNTRDNTTGRPFYSQSPGNENKLGQTDVGRSITPNAWYLVKMHFDTSTTSNNRWEMWIRPVGGSFTKIVEWIGGTTPNFTWTQTSGGGHKYLRIPTTFPGNNVEIFYDAWIYLDDFVMATSEADLPTYDSQGNLSFQPPQNIRIIQ